MIAIPIEKIETTEQPKTGLKMSLARDVLLSALTLVMKSVSTRRTLPILSHVLIEAHEERVYISGTNLETGIRCQVQAHVEQTGHVAVDAKKLLHCVKTFPKGSDIAIEVGDRFVLNCGKRVFTLNYFRDASEFPQLPRAFACEPIILSGDVLRTAIEEVEFAAVNDYSRPVFTAIALDVNENTVNLVAADSVRLAMRSIARLDNRNGLMLLVPADTMRMLAEVLPRGVDVAITWNEHLSQVIFAAGALTVVSRLIEGTFPNYTQVIPKQHKTTFTLGRSDLEQIIKAFLPFAKDSSNILQMVYAGETVTFLAKSSDLESVRDELPAEISGKEGRIFFNILYLSDLLKAVSAESFTFFLSGETWPAVIVPATRDDYQYVVMPMSPNR